VETCFGTACDFLQAETAALIDCLVGRSVQVRNVTYPSLPSLRRPVQPRGVGRPRSLPLLLHPLDRR
jgi:hypothetical protein